MLGNLTAAVQKYQQNNNGRLPNDGSTPAQEDGDEVKLDEGWPCSNSSSTSNPAVCFIRNYMNGATNEYNEWIDPSGYSYGLNIMSLASGETKQLGNSDFNDHMVYLVKHARCDGEQASYSANSRDFVVLYKLEGAGTYCN